MKAYDLDEVMTQLEPVTERTVILTLQTASIQKIASYPACIGIAWSAGWPSSIRNRRTRRH